jgi:hypothetical protein
VTCPRCAAAQELVIAIDLRGVPHTTTGHKTVYDWSVVLACPGCGYGELRAFSHDCWAQPWDEEWDMEWSTQIPPAALAMLMHGMAACPDPSATACECPTHVSVRATYNRAGNLRVEGVPKDKLATERPDAHVGVTPDGVPEFVYRPSV